ncbi:methylated-DNA--[protein]-cysteine S-methyltransferase [Iamia sp. SCSIO 61187]|uniref:methylated-DNA--[protein]-cysteine S-methyltransferase n=1 Tax=Iamia sp. SCSIO 61187 TaxID=2722752 RepID=UPI002106B86D|nr:methylated-DNA--[protein]-cysteine S-methyltransferase [Iamia sp. SCSIO 61187]QYG91085.1 methylated-DNA--[protein]-cysteine S-methyltransferase [Iamia sp. SCSIO 61187]
MTDPALAALAPTPADLGRLRDALADRAAAAELLDVAHRTVDSPHGPLLVAATPVGVVRIAFAAQGHDAVLDRLAAQISPRVLSAPGRLDDAARQLDEYFAGRRRVFDLPVDLRLAHGFRRRVLDHLRSVPYGGTATYTDLAAAAGSPRAVRAVGSACATNPIPIVVPCHRVVRTDGTIGQYLGGTTMKRALLAMEEEAAA